jgi:hypothetical protein
MIRIPKILSLLLVALGCAFVFTSCDEDQFQEETLIDVVTEEDLPVLLEAALLPPPADPTETNPDEERTPCFRFVYPIELVLRNGTVLTAENGEELRGFVSRIRTNNLRANFVYPFDVELANGNTLTLLRFNEFRRLRAFCDARDSAGDEPCFTYNYPIGITVDGESVTVNSGAEWRETLRAAGRDAVIRINYPISVNFENRDRALIIRNAAQHARLRYACGHFDRDEDGTPCFRFNYPVSLTIDGELTEVDNAADWLQTILTAGRDADVRFAFPVTITLNDSQEEIIVESREGWRAVRGLCD